MSGRVIGRFALGTASAAVLLGLCCACGGGKGTSETAAVTPLAPGTPLVSSPPLATVDGIGPDGRESVAFARIEGTIEITEECILLTGSVPDPVTVVWSEGRVAFDEASGTILFRDPGLPQGRERMVELEDGQRVVFGGYGIGSADELYYEFVRSPADSCPEDIWHAQFLGE